MSETWSEYSLSFVIATFRSMERQKTDNTYNADSREENSKDQNQQVPIGLYFSRN